MWGKGVLAAAKVNAPRSKKVGTDMDKIFGGGAGRTVLQLIIASVIVGAIFSFFGLSPQDFWSNIFGSVRGFVAFLGDSIGEVAVTLISYLIIGAAIVIPVWLVARLLSGRR